VRCPSLPARAAHPLSFAALVGAGFYNLMNSNVTRGFNNTFVPNTPGWGFPTSYMNPRVIRLNAEYSW